MGQTHLTIALAHTTCLAAKTAQFTTAVEIVNTLALVQATGGQQARSGTERVGLLVIGLGYVGLPLAVKFCKHRPVVGFDIKSECIAELQAGLDSTRETTPSELAAAR